LTGHIPGTTVLRRHPSEQATLNLGSNHVGLRAANERLVLSLIRTHGQLSKAQIAERTGLTAQTASVIARSLVDAGLLVAGAPVRGKVGQPFVPLSLNPTGAMFFGLQVGELEVRLALVNFTGLVIAERSLSLEGRTLEDIAAFTKTAVNDIRSDFDAEQNARLQGIGIAVTAGRRGTLDSAARLAEIDATFIELGRQLHLATYISSDAVAACSGELIYGLGSGVPNFAYLFIGDSLDGGLVQNGQIHFARHATGLGIGRVPVSGQRGETVPLWTLAEHPDAASDEAWLSLLARGIAHAVYAASVTIGCDLAIIDGSLPLATRRRIVVSVKSELARLDPSTATRLAVREGTRERRTVSLGAACLPLVDRFFPQSETSSGTTVARPD
jgi:hypothetical protein